MRDDRTDPNTRKLFQGLGRRRKQAPASLPRTRETSTLGFTLSSGHVKVAEHHSPDWKARMGVENALINREGSHSAAQTSIKLRKRESQ